MRDKIISFVIGVFVGIGVVFGLNFFLGTSSDMPPDAGMGERPDMSNMSEEEMAEMKAGREAMRGSQ